MRLKFLIIICIIIFTGSLLINSYRKYGVYKTGKTPLTLNIPQGFPDPEYDFFRNPLTQ